MQRNGVGLIQVVKHICVVLNIDQRISIPAALVRANELMGVQPGGASLPMQAKNLLFLLECEY